MSKAATNGMKYEKLPLIKPLAKRKAALKMTTDMTRLSTFNIMRFLYRRHSVAVWEALCVFTWVGIIWVKLG